MRWQVMMPISQSGQRTPVVAAVNACRGPDGGRGVLYIKRLYEDVQEGAIADRQTRCRSDEVKARLRRGW